MGFLIMLSVLVAVRFKYFIIVHLEPTVTQTNADIKEEELMEERAVSQVCKPS